MINTACLMAGGCQVQLLKCGAGKAGVLQLSIRAPLVCKLFNEPCCLSRKVFLHM